ncbi:MAG: EAL domain-containing protein [Acidobacteria bacterium]|nr:MAG: EAL domain-containing protein [Acidobacteriota bacterium]
MAAPVKGAHLPGAFLPVAEETGLIVPIGWRVMEEACRQVAGWHDRFPKDRHISMNVNLSRKQFVQGDLIGRLRDILTETRVDPRVLRLEVSEGLITSNSESTVARLRQLKDLGVRLHIDDFGTGSASLSYLHRLPTDTIKIDRSFVSRVDAENGRVGIIRTIISLARSLGMQVTAEGLETASQLARLRELECESGQGYYFSKPLTPRAADELIARHPHW